MIRCGGGSVALRCLRVPGRMRCTRKVGRLLKTIVAWSDSLAPVTKAVTEQIKLASGKTAKAVVTTYIACLQRLGEAGAKLVAEQSIHEINTLLDGDFNPAADGAKLVRLLKSAPAKGLYEVYKEFRVLAGHEWQDFRAYFKRIFCGDDEINTYVLQDGAKSLDSVNVFGGKPLQVVASMTAAQALFKPTEGHDPKQVAFTVMTAMANAKPPLVAHAKLSMLLAAAAGAHREQSVETSTAYSAS